MTGRVKIIFFVKLFGTWRKKTFDLKISNLEDICMLKDTVFVLNRFKRETAYFTYVNYFCSSQFYFETYIWAWLVWSSWLIRSKSRKLSLELFHFKIELHFFNALRFCQEFYYIFMVFRWKNVVSIREYMNFKFIEQNILVGRGMQIVQ